MARFVLTRRSPLPPAVCWERLTAWPRHGDRVPFTRVTVVRGGGGRAGDAILARTVIGPFRFDDPMEIVGLTAPAPGRDGLCRLEKRGRLVLGWAELRVRAPGQDAGRAGETGAAAWSEVTWTEELRVARLPALLDPLVARAGRLVFGRVLDQLLEPGPSTA
ncbi:SRPBCC family protein [Kitasatospora sp. NPDC057940]|uniref:SRPBCC family protein n=1 Tax=Kitasatospora sp. NPDC057940 TaxID=3346285 RepID=UPI0036D76BB0